MSGDSEIELLTLARQRDALTKCPTTQESLEVIWSNTLSRMRIGPCQSSISGHFASSSELVRMRLTLSSSSTTLVLIWTREGIVQQNVSSLFETVPSSASKTSRGGLSGVPSVVRMRLQTRVAMALAVAYSEKTLASSPVP